LIAGNDLAHMTPEIGNILMNKELIAVDQDPLGTEGTRVRKNGDKEIWVRPLQDGSRAVVLFNRGAAETEISVNWEDVGCPANSSAAVRDLWLKKDLGKFAGKFSAQVPSHGVAALKVTP